MALTSVAVKQAKPSEKTRRLFDEHGLYIEITPKGGKWWRFKYRFNRKEKRISLGTHPEVTLVMARQRRDEARRLLSDGIDPSQHRKASKAQSQVAASQTFGAVSDEWLSKRSGSWSQIHTKNVESKLKNDILPWLGSRPVSEIMPAELLELVRRVENRGAIETAHRVLSICGQVLRFAVAGGLAQRDASQDLKGALATRKPQHLAAAITPAAAGEILRAIVSYQGTHVVRAALKLAPLTFVRPGELRHARWSQLDFKTSSWSFRVTKTDTDHIVPLSSQAKHILENLYHVTGHCDWVFPSARSRKRPMSNNAVLAALRRLEIPPEEMSGHGFRAMARTLLDEELGFRPDIIEHQLAHAVRDPLGRAYNRTQHIEERRRMMQCWADYLEQLAGEPLSTKQKYIFDVDSAMIELGGKPTDWEIQRLVSEYSTYELAHRKELLKNILDGETPIFMAHKKIEILERSNITKQGLGSQTTWATAKIRRFVRRVLYLRYRVDEGMTRIKANQQLLRHHDLPSAAKPKVRKALQKTIRDDTKKAMVDTGYRQRK